MVNLEGEFEPNETTRELYDEAYQVYRGIYEAIAAGGQYQALSQFSARHF